MSIKKKLLHTLFPVAWKFLTSYLKLLVKVTPHFSNRFIGEKLKKMADLEPDGKTQGYTLNLNKNVTEKTQGVVLPIDMMKQRTARRRLSNSNSKANCIKILKTTSYKADLK